MPTPEDVFGLIVRTAIRTATFECYCAEEADVESGKCVLCVDGTMKVLARSGVEVGATKNCTLCKGSGLCPGCDGAVTVVPDEYSSSVMLTVLVVSVRTMSLTRAQEQFQKFKVQFGVLEAWLAEGR